MRVIIVYAHPASESLNASLRDAMVHRLKSNGHAVQLSDLYAMRWKAVLDADDFLHRQSGTTRLDVMRDSRHAFEHGLQSPDVMAEQEKLQQADAIIFQFPLWWFSMPAILKGWVERVYANGFAYGVGEHSDRRWGERYGEGAMAGKRAMLVVTTGGWSSHYGPRGINGPIEDLLFPIHHGILFYPGFAVLPPAVFHRIGPGRVGWALYAEMVAELEARMNTLFSTEPIPYRTQNGGDYDIPALTLRDELAPGVAGFAAHLRNTQT